MFGIFKSVPAQQEIINSDTIDRHYKYWRLHIMITMFVGYATFYFTRKSFTFAMPAMITDLGMDKADIGILATLFYIIYGCSKFLSGIISDHSNPRYFMGIGLIATGVTNILFGFSSSLVAFSILWGLNAFFQGWGWPACSKLLNFWYARSERGFWWAIWNTAHNVGGALIPLLVGISTLYYGWRYGLIIPGIVAIILGCFVCWRLRDKPSTLGLPTIGHWKNDLLEIEHASNSRPLPVSEILKSHILQSKPLWLLAAASILVYIVRTAMNDWGNLYLIEVGGYSLVTANAAVTGFEIGGFLGSIVAGWGSDRFFHGERVPMLIIFSIGVLLSSISLCFSAYAPYSLQAASFFFIGFFIFGPQMLLGMTALEASHKEAAGAATGFIGLFSYIGAALAGYPVAKIIELFHWSGFFALITVAATITAAILLPFCRVKRLATYGKTVMTPAKD